jgi:hypothetical protein
VSILGIYKDGRMSPEAWDELGAKLVRKEGCGAGYDGRFVGANRGLAMAIDEQVRSNGVSDALLARLTPAATGDAILVLTVAGQPPKSSTVRGTAPPPSSRRGRRSGGTSDRTVSDGNAFEIAASVYSIRQRQRVAWIQMRSTKADVDEAIRQFADRFAAEFPMAACGGWDWQVPISEEQIRQIKEE